MEIMGTNFTITLGSWRLSLRFAVEDVDAPQSAREVPHHIRFAPDEEVRPRSRRL